MHTMHTPLPVIVAKKLRIVKNKQTILRDLSFSVPSGIVAGLIGPSGSGKTTLMRAVVGVQAVDGSQLEVLGSRPSNSKLRSRIGYVSQSPSVYGDLTVEQNLQYFAVISGVSKSRVDQVIDTVRLTKQQKQVVDTLSGGQRARVSLAVALLGNPELLVLDEPTVGLDPILREELWGLFAQLAAGGKTLLISSHVMDEAARCDQLLLLRDGEVLWNDRKDLLLEQTKTLSVGEAFIAMIKKGED